MQSAIRKEDLVKGKFKVSKALDIPYKQMPSARRIEMDQALEFWKDNAHHKSDIGCYVFVLKLRNGSLPYYVGKATMGFFQEVFTDDKLEKCNSSLAEYNYAVRPEMILLYYQNEGRGRNNIAAINDLEKTLIAWAVSRNAKLKNTQNTNTEDEFEILGLNAQGKPSSEMQYFKTVMLR